jgi:hypothetical protein
MQGNDKAITSLVRSMKRTLKNKHGIDVPYSALRASYLQAIGESPHAFAGRNNVVEAKVELSVPAPAEVVRNPLWRTLYLVENDLGCLERLALDKEGSALLPEDFEFKNAVLERQFAEVPRVSRYGLPDYLVKAKEFFAPFGIELASTYTFWHTDLGDDSGDKCKMVVSMPDADWSTLLKAALEQNPSFAAEVAEWVGMHYHRLFENESTGQQLDWVERFLSAKQEAEDEGNCDRAEEPESAKVDVTFEWTYQNDKTGSVDAYVELDTGLIVLQDHVPEDVWLESVRTQVRVPYSGDDFDDGSMEEVYPAFNQKNFAGRGDFKVTREVAVKIATEYGLTIGRR